MLKFAGNNDGVAEETGLAFSSKELLARSNASSGTLKKIG